MKQNENRNNLATYEQMGIAAMLPGMQHMLELMKAELDGMHDRLGALQSDAIAEPYTGKKRGRPPKKAARVTAGRSGWPSDPEERKAEMARRQAVARKKKGLPAKPKPGGMSEETKAKLRKAANKRWAGMNFKQRKARLAALASGKVAKMKSRKREPAAPLVRLAEAS